MPRVLVADDDPAIRDTLKRGLAANGYEVRVAADGIEALEMLEHEDFDIVVSDINMPSMDGIELLIQVVEERPAIKVIAMSGGGIFPKRELLTDARMLGAVDILEKPFDLRELLRCIEDTLEDG